MAPKRRTERGKVDPGRKISFIHVQLPALVARKRRWNDVAGCCWGAGRPGLGRAIARSCKPRRPIVRVVPQLTNAVDSTHLLDCAVRTPKRWITLERRLAGI